MELDILTLIIISSFGSWLTLGYTSSLNLSFFYTSNSDNAYLHGVALRLQKLNEKDLPNSWPKAETHYYHCCVQDFLAVGLIILHVDIRALCWRIFARPNLYWINWSSLGNFYSYVYHYTTKKQTYLISYYRITSCVITSIYRLEELE